MPLPKKVIVVRHGARIPGEDVLAGYGRRQMEYMATQLRDHCAGQRCVVYASTAKRGRDSAAALSAILELTPELRDALWTESSREFDDVGILACIDVGDRFDVVILVTHYEVASWLPEELMRWRLDTSEFRRPRSHPSEGVGASIIVDCVAKTCTDVPAFEGD